MRFRHSARIDLGGAGLVLVPSVLVWPSVVALYEEPWPRSIIYHAGECSVGGPAGDRARRARGTPGPVAGPACSTRWPIRRAPRSCRAACSCSRRGGRSSPCCGGPAWWTVRGRAGRWSTAARRSGMPWPARILDDSRELSPIAVIIQDPPAGLPSRDERDDLRGRGSWEGRGTPAGLDHGRTSTTGVGVSRCPCSWPSSGCATRWRPTPGVLRSRPDGLDQSRAPPSPLPRRRSGGYGVGDPRPAWPAGARSFPLAEAKRSC